MKRKICFVIVNRANYGRVKYLMKRINQSNKFILQVVLMSSAVLKKYGEVAKDIEKQLTSHDSVPKPQFLDPGSFCCCMFVYLKCLETPNRVLSSFTCNMFSGSRLHIRALKSQCNTGSTH